MQKVIVEMAKNEQLNLFPVFAGANPRVTRGQGSLRTCFQYLVYYHARRPLMRIKVYDKTLDIVGREGCLTVGSRIANILGSKYSIDMTV